MKERLEAVQRIYWTLLIATLGLFAASLTGGNNGATKKALTELSQFAKGFDREALESTLLEHARQQGRVDLEAVARSVQEIPGVPDLSVTPGVLINPHASVSLTTLKRISAHHVPTQVKLGVPDMAGLQTGLAFNLARRAGSKAVQIQSAELESGIASPKDLTVLADTEVARRELAEVRRQHKLAEKKYEKLEELLESRKKWRAHWKVLKKTNEKRLEALRERNQRKDELNAALKKYQALAAQAESFKLKPGDARDGIAVAEVKVSEGGKSWSFAFPVAIEQREVAVPALTGVDFVRTRRAGLWKAVRDLSPQEAVKAAEAHFGWHYVHVQVGPLSVGGMTVLHLWPLLFPIMLLLLRKRVASVSESYDPFSVKGFDLPRVGGGHIAVDALLLALLPTVAAAMASLDLWAIDEIPAIGAACTMSCALLGPWATLELRELRGLKDAVRHSHSNPPPAG